MKNKFFIITLAAQIVMIICCCLSWTFLSYSAVSSAEEKIPDSIVSFSHGYIVVVDKQNQKLYVFHKSKNFHKVFETSCSTGKNPGAKKIEGDAKTPNGIFFATKLLTNPGDSETFGSMAFILDYPTLPDKRANRNGGNIWIHGTTKKLLPRQSSGCVVLSDEDLKRLANFIYLNKTPIIISESVNWVPQDYVPSSKNELENIATTWSRAFIEQDLKKLDSLYMRGAEIQGERRRDLNEKISQVKSLGPHFSLQPRDISIIQDHDNAVILFDQIFSVSSPTNYFRGFFNKLFLERVDNQWYIVDNTAGATKLDILRKTLPESEKQIHQLINRWLTSWQSGDMKTYRDCYDPKDFESRGMNLDAWISYKINVRNKSNDIRISLSHLKISVNNDTAEVSFIQSYNSSIMKSKGKKTLEIRKTGNEWKIIREIM